MQGAEVLGGTLVRIGGGIAGAFALAVVLGAIDPKLRIGSELADLVRPWRERSARRGLFLAALFGSVLGLPLFHLALRALPSGVAAVLFATTPLFTLPLGLFLGERHGWRAALGAVLGLSGVAVVVSAAV
jgi:drug/metabolite transporter (DMT)-like permease